MKPVDYVPRRLIKLRSISLYSNPFHIWHYYSPLLIACSSVPAVLWSHYTFKILTNFSNNKLISSSALMFTHRFSFALQYPLIHCYIAHSWSHLTVSPAMVYTSGIHLLVLLINMDATLMLLFPIYGCPSISRPTIQSTSRPFSLKQYKQNMHHILVAHHLSVDSSKLKNNTTRRIRATLSSHYLFQATSHQ